MHATLQYSKKVLLLTPADEPTPNSNLRRGPLNVVGRIRLAERNSLTLRIAVFEDSAASTLIERSKGRSCPCHGDCQRHSRDSPSLGGGTQSQGTWRTLREVLLPTHLPPNSCNAELVAWFPRIFAPVLFLVKGQAERVRLLA